MEDSIYKNNKHEPCKFPINCEGDKSNDHKRRRGRGKGGQRSLDWCSARPFMWDGTLGLWRNTRKVFFHDIVLDECVFFKLFNYPLLEYCIQYCTKEDFNFKSSGLMRLLRIIIMNSLLSRYCDNTYVCFSQCDNTLFIIRIQLKFKVKVYYLQLYKQIILRWILIVYYPNILKILHWIIRILG